MDHLKILQSRNILKNADSYILTNKEKRELIDAFNSLSKINKIELGNKEFITKKANFNPHSIGLISKNLTLKEMINLSLTNKKMRETMTPIIEDKRNSLEQLRVWLRNLPRPKNYTIEQLDQLDTLYLNHNQLTSFPNLNLPNLRELYLHNNQLKSIPTLSLSNLEILNLSNNRLIKLQDLSLPNLQSLHLYNNQLKKLPILTLPYLRKLTLQENPLPETEKARLKSIYGDKIIFSVDVDEN